MKLDNIFINGQKKSYKVSLYGGLGSYLQKLTYNANGEKMSLADCNFGRSLTFTINAQAILDAWEVLNTGTEGDMWSIINFAPCYNGLPSDFDTDKVVVSSTDYPYMQYVKNETEDNQTVSYTTKQGYVLVKMKEKVSEWGMQELRSYLQRPVIRVKHLIQAIASLAGEYTVRYDENFFTDQNVHWEYTWMTLPMINELTELVDNGDGVKYPRSGATITKEMLLKGDKTPADYLISFCKMFGLSIVVDEYNKRVDILTRVSMFDKENVLDIEKNVDLSKGLSITPIPYQAKWYGMKQETKGEWAAKYDASNTAPFGSYRIDTGYDFAAEEKQLLDGLAYKGAVEVAEQGKLFANYVTTINDQNVKVPPYVIVGGTYSLYNAEGGTVELDVTLPPQGVESTWANILSPGFDALSKAQFHEADNKPIDGRDVILFYQGYIEHIEDTYSNLRITDDMEIMDTLNEGTPCWSYRSEVTRVQRFPMFGRYLTRGSNIVEALDFGIPSELPIPNVTISPNTSLYHQYWQTYIQDRYDNDSKVLNCWLNVQGLPQGYDLLRRFVYFQGAIWSVNKIMNQSLSSDEPVQVELVKVQNIENYR